MIDPTKPTNFNRTSSELEEWILFCVVVAGKSSFQQAQKLDAFLKLETEGNSPFEKLQIMDKKGLLRYNLEQVKMGQYNRIEKVFRSLMPYMISTVTLDLLEQVPGIGPKTSRFFMLHSYPNQNIACLDTHILHWMREQGYDAPKSTPNLKKYKVLEVCFLHEANKRGMSPAELDIQIWNERVKIFNAQKLGV
jgi:thermostable 8-oxoguanine DNA glycosylase